MCWTLSCSALRLASAARRWFQGFGRRSALEFVPLNRAQLTSSSFSLALRIALSNSVSLCPSFWKAAKMEVRLGVNVGGLTEVGETACFATSTAGAVILSVVIPG